MSEKMSKSEVLTHLAEKTGLKKKEVALVLDELAQLAYQEAHNTFTVPGLGLLALSERPARKMVMRFGPKAGQEIEVPAKRVVKFRVSKAAKEAIIGEGEVKKDDLALIEGIGPKIADAFNKAGIKTFAQLAKTPVEKLKQVLADAEYPGDPTTWPEQAKLAAEGKMDELKQLQERLSGGRVV
jgi:nucleoid DNA-binding protein